MNICSIALMALVSLPFSGFSVAQANENEHGKSVQYECSFEWTSSAGKDKVGDSVTCQVRGTISDKKELALFDRNEDQDNKLWVRCSDGFELRDRDADVKKKRDDLLVCGSDDGQEVNLLIEDIFERSIMDREHDRDFDARLTYETAKGGKRTLSGSCEFDRHGRD